MKKRAEIIMAMLFFGISFVFAQQNDSCKVLMNEISGTYKGDCKDGLAYGKGVAKGKDTYSGKFKEGFPDGKGNYVYENGNKYSGNWTKGLKNGQGEFIYYVDGKEYIQKGYWKDNEYVGKTNPDEFYRITNQSGIQNCSFKKLEARGEKIKISFYGSYLKNMPPELKVTSSTGQVVQENKNIAVYNYSIPNNCAISYVIMTGGGPKICKLTFEILKSGNFEVVIINN